MNYDEPFHLYILALAVLGYVLFSGLVLHGNGSVCPGDDYVDAGVVFERVEPVLSANGVVSLQRLLAASGLSACDVREAAVSHDGFYCWERGGVFCALHEDSWNKTRGD